MYRKQMWIVGTLSLSLIVSLAACGGEPVDGGNEQRGIISDNGPVKADGTNSCKHSCGTKAASGCWCDEACVTFGDCCPDHQALCAAPTQTCADLKCGAGYHCEMKGINGGAVPACIKDSVITCADLTCAAGTHCEMKGINGGSVPVCVNDPPKCQDLGGYCLALTYPMGQCKTGEQADTTAGLCEAIPGGSTTCCLPATPSNVQVTEADNGKIIAAQVGSTVEVKLAGTPTTGYEWTLVSTSSALPLSSSPYTPDPAPPGWVGTGGVYSFLFNVGSAAAGAQHTLKLAYQRSWEPQPIQTFSVTISVP